MSGPTNNNGDTSSGPKLDGATLDLSLNITWHRDETWSFINDLRTRHYPQDLLVNGAHIGLFARLTVPGNDLAEIIKDLQVVVSKYREFEFTFEAVAKKPWNKLIGIPVRSPQLKRLRAELNDRWMPRGITNSSERGYNPHATIHARVSKAEAQSHLPAVRRAVEERVRSRGRMKGRAVGVDLLEDKEGEPWRIIASLPFG